MIPAALAWFDDELGGLLGIAWVLTKADAIAADVHDGRHARTQRTTAAHLQHLQLRALLVSGRGGVGVCLEQLGEHLESLFSKSMAS